MSTNYASYCFLLLLFSLAIPTTFSLECAKKAYGDGNTVCVCNSTYCDNLVLPSIEKDSILVVESSKDGKRFKTSRVNFTLTNDKPSASYKTWDIFVNTTKRYQKIIGFGGAFTDAAGLNIRHLSEDVAKQLIENYYGKDGIEYTIGRIPIAGCDFSTHPYAYDEVENDFDLKNFSLSTEDFKYKIPLIKMATKASAQNVFLFGSPWSAPAWMKTNKKLNESGFLIGPVGGKYYETWANYIVKFLKEYEKQGVKLWGLTPQNEPLTGFDPNYRFNTMGFNGAMEREFVKRNLGPALKNAGYQNLTLMIYDHNIDQIVNFSTTLISDKDAAEFVSGIALHWYANNLNMYDQLDVLGKRFPDKFILATEACYDQGRVPDAPVVSLGNWTRGEGYARDILMDLNHGVVGWVDWNLALDEEGGPNWVGNYVDCPIIVNKTANEYYKNPMFYFLGHFSKFLKRNSARVDVKASPILVDKELQVVSFVTPENELVVVAMNPSNEDVILRIHDNYQRKIVIKLGSRSIVTTAHKI